MMKKLVEEQKYGLENPERDGLHHIGNSTHWVVFEGVKILTDPWLAEPAEHILKHSIPPIPLPRNPDIIVISHEHDDHFDPLALDRLDRSAAVVAPEGKITNCASKMGFVEVRAARAGQRVNLRGLTIDVVKGKHSVPEVCYKISRGGRSFFFGGDSMITREILAMADEKPVPFVILPGEYSRLLGFRFVMTPEEAIGLAKRFRAEVAVLTHHEQVITGKSWLNWLVSIKKVPKENFPEWFSVPQPGDYVPFPWSHRSAEPKAAFK
ncbi:MAG: MBL fold metallo-hydrolase [Deltaproteobacteria bacterium]